MSEIPIEKKYRVNVKTLRNIDKLTFFKNGLSPGVMKMSYKC